MSGLGAARRARSFRHLSLRITQLHQLAASQLSRDHLATALADGLREITARLLPPRRRRSNPRVVKRKMSNFGVKRDERRSRPSPPATPPTRERRPHWRTVPISPPTKTRPSQP